MISKEEIKDILIKKAAALGFETSKLLFLDHDKLSGKANSTDAKNR
jgi:hypothetical protein